MEYERRLSVNAMIPVDTKTKNFNLLMNIYQRALDKIYNDLSQIRKAINEIYEYDIINHITKRIKSPDSIMQKMKKKNYEMNYKELVEKIDDIAGIRIICPVKTDIYTIVNIINKMPNIQVLETKDYISKPKKSGYSGYHIIVQTPVEIEGKNIPVKVEIQLRTMAMDAWATNEHKVKYKTNKKLSKLDSKKLVIYAKLLNFLDNRISQIYKKQEIKNEN